MLSLITASRKLKNYPGEREFWESTAAAGNNWKVENGFKAFEIN